MASEFLKKWHITPQMWLIAAILSAFGTGITVAIKSPWWIFLAVCTILCSHQMLQRVMSINKRMRYLIEATLSGDFSYKFPLSGVDRDEK